ncbi:hypothetical protein Slin15195_G089820 [Septoria linicola]|uniref:Uncharacterized protein n=1 Tax=Septoria linicola TaxID=215465 RepID=A0A9Q9B147_9PEZI|nr:hypothetical protein Slin15195_G089820 [Septoria linicola]
MAYLGSQSEIASTTTLPTLVNDDEIPQEEAKMSAPAARKATPTGWLIAMWISIVLFVSSASISSYASMGKDADVCSTKILERAATGLDGTVVVLFTGLTSMFLHLDSITTRSTGERIFWHCAIMFLATGIVFLISALPRPLEVCSSSK